MMKKKVNTVMRQCDSCGRIDKDDYGFLYLGGGVWSCRICGCKYTHIEQVVETE